MSVMCLQPSRLTFLLLTALTLSASGCLAAVGIVGAAGAAGGAGYAYFQGEVCDQFPASRDDAYVATRTALTELGMPILEENRAEGTFKSRTRDDDAVVIKLKPESSKIPVDGPMTRVCVRVSAFGDRSVSERIIEQIAAHLTPRLAPQPTPWTGPPVPQAPRTTAPPPLADGLPVTPPLPVPGPSGSPSPSSHP